jgi:hypothetical protein
VRFTLRFIFLFAMLVSANGWAQTFRMPCEVSATIPALDSLKLPPEKAEVEIQTMGKNIFLRLNGSKYYFVTVSSLSTDEFMGRNLTTGKEMGAWRKYLGNSYESEIRIGRESVMLTAYQDIVYQGKLTRVYIEGPCTLPR